MQVYIEVQQLISQQIRFAKKKKKRRKNPNNIFAKFTVDNTNQVFRTLSDVDKVVFTCRDTVAFFRGIHVSFLL